MPNAYLHLALINTESICCEGDSDFVNLIRDAVSTLFSLPCPHTPLTLSQSGLEQKALSVGGVGLHRARYENSTAPFHLQHAVPRQSEQLVVLTLQMHRQLFHIASTAALHALRNSEGRSDGMKTGGELRRVVTSIPKMNVLMTYERVN